VKEDMVESSADAIMIVRGSYYNNPQTYFAAGTRQSFDAVDLMSDVKQRTRGVTIHRWSFWCW
jgi:hypothetical protein